MNRTIKRIFVSIISVIVVVGVFVILSIYYLKSSVPEYSGQLTASQLNSSVEIYRDSIAVPYIFADNDHDAAFALGYVHAQERLFQMDFFRRAAEGRLSEVIGSKTLLIDKMFRTLGLYKNVVDNFDKYSPEIIEHLQAYSDGINYFIENNESNLPIEFSILGYKPELWKPAHSLVIGKLLAWELNISWWSDVAFSHLVQKLDKDLVAEILPDFPENGPYIIPENLSAANYSPTGLMNVDKQFRKFLGFTGTHIGSNNWVVAPEKSVTGKPIIANDPHLGLQIPGKWYVAVIRCDTWNCEGFTLPGVPVVIIGKNKNISWVVTNVMADDADFYLEKVNDDTTRYFVDNKWLDLESRKDTIHVKDSSSVVINIHSTHRGPIISDVHLYKQMIPDSTRNYIPTSMKWTALDFTNDFTAILNVNKAKNWDEFKSALSEYSVPGQNFVYADDKDNIGYICGAKLPARKTTSPTMVFDGTTSSNDWDEYIPYDKMPKLFNPNTNFIATANNKTQKDFPYHISNVWEPSSRIKRITELLNSKEKHGVKDYKEYQNDFYSHYAQELVPYIFEAFKGVSISDENLITSLELLKQWDFVVDKRSQTPTIFLTFFQKLMENIFLDEMSETLFKEYIFMANLPYRSVLEMMQKDHSVWFDNISTDEIETKNSIIRQSMVDALTELEAKFGNQLSLWQWGGIHKIEFKHTFHGVSSIIDNILDDGPYSISGDGTTLFNTEYSFTDPYYTTLGPSMRYIFDFSKPNEFLFVLPNGQSGNPFSPHYSDMTNNWLNKGYYKLSIDEQSIKSSNFEKLILLP